MKVKRRVKKVGLKFNIQKTKIMASSPITSQEVQSFLKLPSPISSKNFQGYNPDIYQLVESLMIVLLVAQSCLTLRNPMDHSPSRLLCPQESPGKNTGVGCHPLLQGIFPTQESNPGLLHCWWILNCLSHQGIPLYPLGARRKGWVSHEGLWSQPALFHPALLTTVAPSFTGHYPLQANWFPLNHQVQLFFSLSRICFS